MCVFPARESETDGTQRQPAGRQLSVFNRRATDYLAGITTHPAGDLVVCEGLVLPQPATKMWTLKAWKYAFSDTSGVLESLWLTIGISLAATLLSIVVGVPAGRALGMYQFKGKSAVELLILAPMIVPGIAVVLGIHSVFISLGLTNSVPGVILVHLIPTIPYMVLVMAGIFANYDPAFESQARSLGASAFKTFWYVTLPAIMPGIIVGGLFAFLVSWSQYILTLLIGGGRVVTLPLLLFNFATSGRNDITCLLYTSPSPRDRTRSRMPSSA